VTVLTDIDENFPGSGCGYESFSTHVVHHTSECKGRDEMAQRREH